MRRRLPDRRVSSAISVIWQRVTYQITIGWYDDMKPAEVFVHCPKVGSDVEAVSRDAAIAVSLALQHGCSPEVIHSALTKGENGDPASFMGKLLELVMREAKQYEG